MLKRPLSGCTRSHRLCCAMLALWMRGWRGGGEVFRDFASGWRLGFLIWKMRDRGRHVTCHFLERMGKTWNFDIRF